MRKRTGAEPGMLLLSALLLAVFALGCGTATIETSTGTPEGGDPKGAGDPAEPDGDEPDEAEPMKARGDLPKRMEHPAKKSSADAVVAVTDENSKCEKDEDCVPNGCCHSKQCVNAEFKPDCEGVMCTMDCRGGTMDCGYGKCICKEGKCFADIQAPPKPKIVGDPKPKAPLTPQ